ncbi:hypothetical protein CC1G_14950 [Coprinopsis cinerea okayama7|uniref:Uncharacterized protein n=1 Tax=Coprinopsis cinerea (strain Okayama-7 / 130 / ATCC MYA-4618 / FGSC 9003) TaxID=240176 RepID=D6RP44_COPC7|nr:hypothetical protein CC1G_14950 [Coprinopsis cinerea okayama7\|eukprot:XP_002910619.1 hypothetical protein CC1G_14950 [Coprinopsis cinerea okayama7\
MMPTKIGSWPFQVRLLIVPEDSVKLGIAGEQTVNVNANHSNVCKFRVSQDAGFVLGS